jgi:hypothetical protein
MLFTKDRILANDLSPFSVHMSLILSTFLKNVLDEDLFKQLIIVSQSQKLEAETIAAHVTDSGID